MEGLESAISTGFPSSCCSTRCGRRCPMIVPVLASWWLMRRSCGLPHTGLRPHPNRPKSLVSTNLPLTPGCSWEFLRGQEGDTWRPLVEEPPKPEGARGLEGPCRWGYWRNQTWAPIEHDEDYSTPRCFRALTTTIDLMPTFLELHGMAVPEQVHGRSLCHLLAADADHHAAVLYGGFAKDVCLTDGRYRYFRQALPESWVHHHTMIPRGSRARPRHGAAHGCPSP